MNNQYPNYQQYNVPQPPKKPGEGLDGFVNFILKLLPILTIVFLGMGATAFLYQLVCGLINAGDYDSFGLFIDGIANAFSSTARYFFYAVVCAGIYKIAKK